MLRKFTHNGLTWIDLENPTREDVVEVLNTYSLNSRVAEELLIPTHKPKVDVYKNYLYLILHFPSLRHIKTEKNQEVDFVVGKNFIITAHYHPISALQAFQKNFEVASILDKDEIGPHSGHIFYLIIKKLYRTLGTELDNINDSLKRIEEKIFKGKEKQMVKEISEVARELLDFKQSTTLHSDVLGSFEEAGKTFFGSEFNYHLKAILAEYFKMDTSLQNSLGLLKELRETNNSLLATRQNEVMKIFSIMAFVTFPLALIADIFALPTRYSPPIIGHPFDFWIIIGIMFVAALIMFAFFSYKKWW